MPVADQVVRDCPRRAGVGLEEVERVVGRPRERVVSGVPGARLLVVLGRGHVDDPEELPARFVDQLELTSQLKTQQAEHLRHDSRLVGDEEQGVARRSGASRSSRSSPRNLAIGDDTSPSARKTR